MSDFMYSLAQRLLEPQKSRGLRKTEVEDFTLGLLSILFPERGIEDLNLEKLSVFLRKKRFILINMLESLDFNRCEFIADQFFQYLPLLKEKLKKDAAFFLEEDPASKGPEEVILCYPGFLALGVYRMAHFFFQNQVPLLPRMMTEFAHEKTGIDIHPGAELGCPLLLDHGTGIVIGETASVGNYSKIYQGVTLGALSVNKNLRQKVRHPTIGEYCVIYSNATILGGKTFVGHHSIIGGNVWLTESVPPFSLIFHEREKTGQKLKVRYYK
ncbi:MAG: serine O-acetyltransferase [Bdellovibrionota bacterium]|nr:serine O-acetyltransferase [Bdellovibrionota bacterium]